MGWLERIVAGAFVAFGLYAIFSATQLRVVGADGRLGPGAFPLMAAVILAVLAVWDFGSSLRVSRAEAAENTESGTGTAVWRREATIAFVLLSSILVLDKIGFLAAATYIVAPLMRLFGERRWKVIAGVSVAIAVITFALFALLFGVRLRPGLDLD